MYQSSLSALSTLNAKPVRGDWLRLSSVLIGKAERIDAKCGYSGIFKKPAAGEVYVSLRGLEGDVIIDRANHGTPDQAVYLMGSEDYAFWTRELGQPLSHGTFGENMVVEGLGTLDVHVGDRFQIGEVCLRACAPRVPCSTLARRMDDTRFPARFAHRGRVGVYCAVEREGTVSPGLTVRHLSQGQHAPRIVSLLRGWRGEP